MQNFAADITSEYKFRDFLKSCRWRILTVFLLAYVVRLMFWVIFPPNLTSNDSGLRYLPTAINILNGNGFSLDTTPPFSPSEACVPLYPLFIAAVYAVFGSKPVAVVAVQIVLDLFTCLLVAFVSFNLAPPQLKKLSGVSSLVIYGVFSWFTFFWTVSLLTETLAIFLTMLTIALCISAMRNGRKSIWSWCGAGLSCGLAILTRPDSLLLAAAVILFVSIRLLVHRSWKQSTSILSFCLAVALTLTPWTVRNYLAFNKFQPLASEWAFTEGGYMPINYLYWIKTWMKDETYFYYVFNQAFIPGTEPFEPEKLPDDIFDSVEERQRVTALMEKYNQTLYFTPEIDEEFRLISDERVKRSPLRFFIALPLKRTASLWLTGFATRHPHNKVLILRILSVLPIIIGGIAGFILCFRQSSLAAFLLSIIIIRTIFLAYHYAPETRYIVEVYPAMIAACGVSVATVWLIILRRFKKSDETGQMVA